MTNSAKSYYIIYEHLWNKVCIYTLFSNFCNIFNYMYHSLFCMFFNNQIILIIIHINHPFHIIALLRQIIITYFFQIEETCRNLYSNYQPLINTAFQTYNTNTKINVKTHKKEEKTVVFCFNL